jgi:ATP-binding cassette, subfamily C, bacterial
MTQKTSRPTAALVLFMRDLLKFQPSHLAAVFGLMLARSLTEGVGFVLLIPLLGLGSALQGGTAAAGDLPQGLSGIRALFGEHPTTGALLTVFLMAMLLRAALSYASAVASNAYLAAITNDVRQRVYTALSRASWLHLAGSRQAEDTYALTGQVECVGHAAMLLLNLASGGLTLLTGLGVALLVSPHHTLAVIVAGAILALPTLVFQRWAYERGHASAKAFQNLYDVLIARMNGLKLAKAFAIEMQLEQDFVASAEALRKAEIATNENAARATLVQDVTAALLLVVLVYAALVVFKISSVELIVLIMVFARLAPIGQGIQSNLRSLAGLMPDYQILLAREAAALAAAEPLPSEICPIPLRQSLAVDGVGFKYPVALNVPETTPVLNDISVTIAAGSTVGILGLSGAGKSTLADIMAGLIPPDRGHVAIDGVPLDATTRAHWRASVAYVPQDAPLFHDTLRANLRIGARQASDAEIWASLETVHAAELVRGLPQGLDTPAGDRGVRLSGGERQRLRLASALLRRPQLLILDESTNALSPADEVKIIASLQAVRGAMTVILIAHRTTSVMWTDRVLIVSDGQITADGAPGEVVAIVKGRE